MTSIGNDIISLNAINPQRTKQVRFYSKIVSPSELKLYSTEEFSGMSFGNFVWLAWSIKESVYKFQKRNFPDLKFSPAKIEIDKIDFPKKNLVPKFKNFEFKQDFFYKDEFHIGTARFENNIFYFKSIINEKVISTVVSNDEKFENTWWGFKSIDDNNYESQSKEVRTFLLNELKKIFPKNSFNIRKHEIGYPVLVREGKDTDIPVSFTHHDHFVGYSFLIKDVI
ncbi:MAG: 4'-phosphopantetheinyl transferase superfamily protein [Ginsengibacter sp.]